MSANRVPSTLEMDSGTILFFKPESAELAELYSKTHQHHAGDSGLDLFCPYDVEICCGQTVTIDLGVRCELYVDRRPASFYLHPRSSMSKTPLMLANSAGVIDAGYRGTLKAAVRYIPTHEDLVTMLRAASGCCFTPCVLPTFHISAGTRLFQICAPNLEPIRVVLTDNLTVTSRGDGAYGSTGGTAVEETEDTADVADTK
jgi:dUTP pyrophosphatase